MVKGLLRTGSRVFASQQHTILSAAVVIGFIYMISAVLGVIRNRLLSGYFGDSTELGIYFAADTIPSLIFSLIVSGSLSAAFIPVFTRYYKQNKAVAWDLTASLLNISLAIFLIFAILVMIFADFIVTDILARNSSLTPESLATMAQLMRVMTIAQVILIFSNFYTSILQSFNRFIIPALAPVTYNIGIILFIILFVGRFGIFAPAYGMIFGALLHMAIQIPMVKDLGFLYSFKFNIRNKGVIETYRLTIPRTIGQAAQKFLVPFYTNLALFISAPSNVILNFATDIQSLPVRVFGMSIGQAALPILSNAIEGDDISKFKVILTKTIQQIVFFVLPMTVLIFVLRVPLVRLAVGASKYSWEATVMTSYTLAFFSISLVAQSLIMILARAFYALRDTKTPFIISTIAILVNAILAYVFVKDMGLGVWSLALAFTIGSFVNFGLLFMNLINRIGGIDLYNFIKNINRIGIASLLMAIFLYLPFKAMDQLVFDTTRTLGLLVLTGTVSIIGFAVYVFLAWIFKIKELDLIIYSINRIRLALTPGSRT